MGALCRKIFLFFIKEISVSFELHAFLFIFYVYNPDIGCRFRKGFRDQLLPTINKFEL